MKRLTLATTLGELLNELDFAACCVPADQRLADLDHREMAHILGVARDRTQRDKDRAAQKAKAAVDELLAIWNNQRDFGARIIDAKVEIEKNGEFTEDAAEKIADIVTSAEVLALNLTNVLRRAGWSR